MKKISSIWKDKNSTIEAKEEFLNGLEFEEVSQLQQMLYLLWKKIEVLEARIIALETSLSLNSKE